MFRAANEQDLPWFPQGVWGQCDWRADGPRQWGELRFLCNPVLSITGLAAYMEGREPQISRILKKPVPSTLDLLSQPLPLNPP